MADGVPTSGPDTTPLKSAPVKIAPDTFAPLKFTLRITVFAKLVFVSTALVKFAEEMV